jgi:hypothetical protein
VTNVDPQPSGPAAPFFGKSAAVALGGALLVGLLVLLGLTHCDQVHRTDLERAEEITAVGDSIFSKIPTDAATPPPRAAMLKGQALYPVSDKTYELPDSRMIRVGTDPEAGLNVYETAMKVPGLEGERAKAEEKSYFLKVAPKRYLRVRASMSGM